MRVREEFGQSQDDAVEGEGIQIQKAAVSLVKTWGDKRFSMEEVLFVVVSFFQFLLLCINDSFSYEKWVVNHL